MMYKLNKLRKDIADYIKRITEESQLDIGTIRAYASDLNALITWLSDNSKQMITTDTFRDYVSYLQETLKLKPATVQRKIMSFKIFFNRVYADDRILYKVHFIKEKTVPKALSMDDASKILTVAENELKKCTSAYHRHIWVRDSALLNLILCTGIRVSECSMLLVSNLDTENGVMTVKSNEKERKIHISSDFALNRLNEWLDLRHLFKPTGDFLFVNKYGTQLKVSGIENVYYKCANLANIADKSSFNSLRHTFAVNLLQNGANIMDVRDALGHSLLSSTEVYAPKLDKEKVLSVFDVRSLLQLDDSKKSGKGSD